jgi:hypothetical protein
MLYHFTAETNLDAIRSDGALYSAQLLNPRDCLSQRSAPAIVIRNQRRVTLRDQRALKKGHVQLTGGWTWEDYLANLASRVFFSPGSADKPAKYGARFGRKYPFDALLRVPFRDLVDSNPGTAPYFCRWNSGAGRTTAGRKSLRGPEIYVLAHDWCLAPSAVAEISFIDRVALPGSTQVRLNGVWQLLFA